MSNRYGMVSVLAGWKHVFVGFWTDEATFQQHLLRLLAMPTYPLMWVGVLAYTAWSRRHDQPQG